MTDHDAYHRAVLHDLNVRHGIIDAPPFVPGPVDKVRIDGDFRVHRRQGIDTTVCGEFFQSRHIGSIEDRGGYLCLVCFPVVTGPPERVMLYQQRPENGESL